jgi:hypothetical protein
VEMTLRDSSRVASTNGDATGSSRIAFWPRYVGRRSLAQRHLICAPPVVSSDTCAWCACSDRSWPPPDAWCIWQSGAAIPPCVCSRSAHTCAVPSTRTSNWALRVAQEVTKRRCREAGIARRRSYLTTSGRGDFRERWVRRGKAVRLRPLRGYGDTAFAWILREYWLANRSSLTRHASEGWRRGWDSNPRAGYPTRRFRGAPVTTTSVPLLVVCVVQPKLDTTLANPDGRANT